MTLAKFDPWSVIPGRAYRAYCAYPEPSLGTIGTISTLASPEISDFEERAAIISLETGLDHGRSSSEAALAAGYESVAELHCHVITSWRDQLTSARATSRAHAELLELTISFTKSPWISRLIALGWDEVALFAYSDDPDSSGGLLQCLLHRRLIAATRCSAVLCRPDGRRTHFHRFGPFQDCARLIWETEHPPQHHSAGRGR
ncbi:MAG: hypothetical protein NXI02_33515 [Rhodobacteraceae bacterium]|nr:hypothetical protein [Paracoccaceae bacterium]